MKSKSVATVKEWIFDKICQEARNYKIYLVCEYKDGEADHTKLRVDEVLAETEKAFKVALDAETAGGHPKAWTAWIPKSAIIG